MSRIRRGEERLKRRPTIGVVASALLAVLMLAWAGVQAQVMQAAMASPAPRSDARASTPRDAPMAGMSMGSSSAPAPVTPVGGKAPAKSTPATCAWCSAAAHLPVLGLAHSVRPPATFVFARWRATAARGPRGPPETTPRARGPPDLSLQG